MEGAKFVETLTGFKYMANNALQMVEDGFIHILSSEESLGYMIGDIVTDKDGISAAAAIAQLYAYLKSESKTLKSYLEAIMDKYGFFVQKNGHFNT